MGYTLTLTDLSPSQIAAVMSALDKGQVMTALSQVAPVVAVPVVTTPVVTAPIAAAPVVTVPPVVTTGPRTPKTGDELIGLATQVASAFGPDGLARMQVHIRNMGGSIRNPTPDFSIRLEDELLAFKGGRKTAADLPPAPAPVGA